jgi:hypothetical protein
MPVMENNAFGVRNLGVGQTFHASPGSCLAPKLAADDCLQSYAREAQTDSLPPFLSVHKLDGSQRHDVQQVIPRNHYAAKRHPLCLPLSRFWGLHLAGNPSKVLITASAMLSSKFIVLMLKVHLIYFTSRSLVLEGIGTPGWPGVARIEQWAGDCRTVIGKRMFSVM